MSRMQKPFARAAKRRKTSFIIGVILLFLLGSMGYTAGSATADSSAGKTFAKPTKAITVSYKDAVLEGYGIEKRGRVPEAKDTLYDGEGYISFFFEEVANAAKPIGSATFMVNVPEAGLYKLSVGYYLPQGNGDKVTAIRVNGAGAGELTLDTPPAGTVRAEKTITKVMLNAGSNTVTILRGWGYYGIEHIKLEPADPPVPGPKKATDILTNPDATPEARALMNYMLNQYGRKIISGQHTLEDAEWIRQQTGKSPAILSGDLMDYSPSRVEKGAASTEIEKMIQWYERGGIVSLCWHWNAPKGIGNEEPGREWWRGFYTEFTTFDVAYALQHPDSEDYRLLIRDIDAIAVQLKRLQDHNVPVLWRPLHEAEGGWFWWGAKGPEPAKQLYRLMYERLTHHHKLNNLIWVWNSEKEEWYPGNEVVDIVSVDIYNPAGDYHPNIAKYDNLLALSNQKKIVALAENGPIPDPDLLRVYGADWNFFSTWTGEHIRDGKTNTLEHLKKIYHHDYILTLDELPADLYSSLTYQAEHGVPIGLALDKRDSYASEFATVRDGTSGKLRIKANAAPGTYTLTVRYKADNGQKKGKVMVNNRPALNYTFTGTKMWKNAALGQMTLRKGENIIDIQPLGGGVSIDYVKLTYVASTTKNPG
ncbi:beta-mannanase [Paenibacillus sp. alder61]|uniref:glycosyl hydrolase n=1 Tax=Paenibacillus sp. alder61 TaxID=2862948 RepID=UPI001CD2813E|nr:glycosyl hydrolase [Paenibacillus sp. alder61]MCA1292322.1 beta-mannanase [Paenibacillus sp. alder61]